MKRFSSYFIVIAGLTMLVVISELCYTLTRPRLALPLQFRISLEISRFAAAINKPNISWYWMTQAIKSKYTRKSMDIITLPQVNWMSLHEKELPPEYSSQLASDWRQKSVSDLASNHPDLSEWLVSLSHYADKNNDKAWAMRFAHLASLIEPEWGTYYIALTKLQLEQDISKAEDTIRLCKKFSTAREECTSFEPVITYSRHKQAITQAAADWDVDTVNCELSSLISLKLNQQVNLDEPLSTDQMNFIAQTDWSKITYHRPAQLARILYHLGLIEEVHMEKNVMLAIKLDPNWSYFPIELANWYWRHNRKQEAIHQLRTCGEAGRSHCEWYQQEYFDRNESLPIGAFRKEIDAEIK